MSEFFHRHSRSLVFLVVMLAIAGVAAVGTMPVGLFPQTTFPRVVVSLDAHDRPADRMELEVTIPVEAMLRSVPGTRHVRSRTSRGSAEISIDFDWNTDMVSTLLMVESAVNQAMAGVPPGTKFEVRRMDPTTFPIIAYSLTSATVSLTELRDLALYEIRPALLTINGVARVGVVGGSVGEYHVIFDPALGDALGLTIDDVARVLSASNTVAAVGRLEDLGRQYLVLSDSRFQTFEQLGQTVVKTGRGGVVRLDDIAIIKEGVEPNWTRVTADGRDAVLFQLYQQLDGNTLAIADLTRKELKVIQARLPAGVTVANWYDQSELIRASALSVRDALGVGILLAFVVLVGFLKSFRISFVAVLAVPVTLAITTLFLAWRGMTFNIMTLGAMAAAVGLIIDDALVMVEHMARRWPSLSGTTAERSIAASREFIRPLAGSSAATMVIFAPLAFLSGVTGAFFRELSLTLATALLVSFLIAWVVVPVLGARFVSNQPPTTTRRPGAFAWIARRAVQHPVWTTLCLLPLAALGYFAFAGVGTGFMPAVDEGGFVLDYRAPPGTSLEETDRLLRQVEAILTTVPEVQTYSRRTGLALGGGLTEANEGDFFVRLHPLPRRAIDAVMNDVRLRVERTVPGIEIEMALLMEDLIGDLTAVPQPIEIMLFGDDMTALRKTAEATATAIATIPGVVDVKSGVVLAGDGIDIVVDRDVASLEGLDPSIVTSAIEAQLTGRIATEIQTGPKLVGVRVWTPEAVRRTTKQLEAVRIRAPDGHLVPASRVASISIVTGQPQLARKDFQRMLAVTGRITGRDMGSTIGDVKRWLDTPGSLPSPLYYRLGGLYAQQQVAFRGLIGVFIAAIALVFTLLLFLYENVRAAIIMMVPALCGAGAAFIGLWVTGIELNITAMMGMTMVVGIVTEVSIFYMSEFTDHTSGPFDERLVAAVDERVRPIAMTTIATMLALSPLALALGEGAALLQPLAVAIIAGLVVQMPLVLVVLPALMKLVLSNQFAGRR